MKFSHQFFCSTTEVTQLLDTETQFQGPEHINPKIFVAQKFDKVKMHRVPFLLEDVEGTHLLWFMQKRGSTTLLPPSPWFYFTS